MPLFWAVCLQARRLRSQKRSHTTKNRYKRLAYRRDCIDGEEGVVMVGREKDLVPETHIGVVLNDKNLFVTHIGHLAR